jgi:hypothetical protein
MVLALIRTYLNIVFKFFVVFVSVQIETAFHNLSLNTVPFVVTFIYLYMISG